jgi:RNA polymerase sigma-70 factor, ECF subfamily
MSQAAHSREAYADADLVAQLRAGDEAAVSRLVEQWSPTMLRVAQSFVDSPQSAEDVVQDAWLGMLSGLARFEGRSSLLELDRALSALPPRQRRVVTMRDVFGMPAEQVCAALGVSPAYQRVLLHRARAVLRAALAGYHGG